MGTIEDKNPNPKSRARARDNSLPSRKALKRKRVGRILKMMLDGKWEKGVSAPQLAKLWEQPLSTVEGYSAEASRMIALNIDTDAVRETLGYYLKRGLKVADRNKDVRGLAEVAKVYAPIAGVTDSDAAKIQVNVVQQIAPQVGRTVEEWIQADTGALLREKLPALLPGVEADSEALGAIVGAVVAVLVEARPQLDARIRALGTGAE